MSERTKSETVRDIAAVIGVVISLVALVGVLSGQTSADAKWQQTVDGQLKAVELSNARISTVMDGRRGFMNDAANRANFLCDRSPECAGRYQPMTVPE